MNAFLLVLGGLLVGVCASFLGLGGGFLVVPFLLFLGYAPQMAVGTSFLAILLISIAAVVAHARLANVDFKPGILLGLGGIIGAQVGSRLVEHVSLEGFKKAFAVALVALAGYLFFKK